jgi:hypothetical protein
MQKEKNNQEAIERAAAKQRRYQADYNRKHKAARERLGLTIAAFNKLPRATKLKELNRHVPPNDKVERQRARQRAWYLRSKAKKEVTSNSAINFCPNCGFNIKALNQ